MRVRLVLERLMANGLFELAMTKPGLAVGVVLVVDMTQSNWVREPTGSES